MTDYTVAEIDGLKFVYEPDSKWWKVRYADTSSGLDFVGYLEKHSWDDEYTLSGESYETMQLRVSEMRTIIKFVEGLDNG